MERIGLTTYASVDRFCQINRIEQFVIEIEADGLFVPIHAPNVETLSPIGITFCKVSIRNAPAVPHSIPPLIATPCRISKNMWNTIDTIEFHHIDFTTRGPLHRSAKCPDGRPSPTGDGYLGTHFKTSIEKSTFSG